MTDVDRLADFLFETGMLARMGRSGFSFLGSGEQSVAEHAHRVAVVAYTLGRLGARDDADHILKMALFHDHPEARTSDLDNVSKRYNRSDTEGAIRDLTRGVPVGEEVRSLIEEFEAEQTDAARLARDADRIELLLSLKEQLDRGNRRAETWMANTVARLQTEEGRRLAEAIRRRDSDGWWMRRDGAEP